MDQTTQIIVGLAGPFASGKTTLAEFLNRQFGFHRIHTRALLAQILEARGQEVNDVNLQNLGKEIMEESGPNAICDLILAACDPAKSYVIDSLRHLSDVDYFRTRVPERFHLVYVDLPEHLRKVRYLSRPGTRDATEEGFNARLVHPVEQEVPQLNAVASAVLLNHDLDIAIAQLSALVLSWVHGRRLGTFREMIEAVTRFHRKHGFDVNTGNRQVMHYRMGLLMEELGEINECLSKNRGNIAEEHADLLILLLGNCITLGLDLEDAFWTKYDRIMQRPGKRIGGRVRVSDWGGPDEPSDTQGYYLIDKHKFLMREDEGSPRDVPGQLTLFDHLGRTAPRPQ